MEDAEHAARVKLAATALNAAIQGAADAGLKIEARVDLEEIAYLNFAHSISTPPRVRVAVVRPL